MSKAYVVVELDYEQFDPIAVYLDKDKAHDREVLEMNKITAWRERQKQYQKDTGKWYGEDWDGTWYGATVYIGTYEVEFL